MSFYEDLVMQTQMNYSRYYSLYMRREKRLMCYQRKRRFPMKSKLTDW